MKKKFLHWLRDNGIVLVIWLYRLYYRSIRVEVEGWDEVERYRAKGGVIFGHLHGDDLATLQPFGHLGLTVMVSMSQDGNALARAMETLGFDTVRGSSSKRGREAFRDMEKLVRLGKSVVFTVDGPTGPRAKVKAGLILLAKRTQAPIFLGIVNPGAGYLFHKTWHQTYLPYPFTKILIRMIGPFYIQPNASRLEFQALTDQLEEALAPSGMAGRT